MNTSHMTYAIHVPLSVSSADGKEVVALGNKREALEALGFYNKGGYHMNSFRK